MTQRIKPGAIVMIKDHEIHGYNKTVPGSTWKVSTIIDSRIIRVECLKGTHKTYDIISDIVTVIKKAPVDINYFNECFEYVKDNAKEIKFIKGKAILK